MVVELLHHVADQLGDSAADIHFRRIFLGGNAYLLDTDPIVQAVAGGHIQGVIQLLFDQPVQLPRRQLCQQMVNQAIE